MFQDVFRRRLKGKRVQDRFLNAMLKNAKLELSDFFIFTFARNPFSAFKSAYGEVSKYVANNRTHHKGSFGDVEQIFANEPQRAMNCLNDIAKGAFHGLVPAHLHTQLWKVMRCTADRKAIRFDFIGHLENLDADWKFVENQLKLPHQPLLVIHSANDAAEYVEAKKLILPPLQSHDENTKKFKALTEQVCNYYKVDFACFGYDAEFCHAA